MKNKEKPKKQENKSIADTRTNPMQIFFYVSDRDNVANW